MIYGEKGEKSNIYFKYACELAQMRLFVSNKSFKSSLVKYFYITLSRFFEDLIILYHSPNKTPDTIISIIK